MTGIHYVALSIPFCWKNRSDYIETHATIASFSSSDSWAILSAMEKSIKAKIEAVGKPLKDWDVQINYGIKTGCNEAFIIDSTKRNEILNNCITEEERKKTDEIIRPILRGRDISRYSYDWAGLWLIWIPWHFPLHLNNSIQGASEKAERDFIEQYPALYNHMLQYKDSLSKRNKAETGIRYEWYTLQRWGANYWEDFLKPKIVWGEISDRSKFAYDHYGNFVPEATTFLMVGENLPYLLCVLNCPLSEWFFSKVGTTTGMGTVRWKKYTIENLLIPNITKEKIKIFESSVSNYLTGKISATEFSQFVNNQIYIIVGLTHDEIDFVEHFYP